MFCAEAKWGQIGQLRPRVSSLGTFSLFYIEGNKPYMSNASDSRERSLSHMNFLGGVFSYRLLSNSQLIIPIKNACQN